METYAIPLGLVVATQWIADNYNIPLRSVCSMSNTCRDMHCILQYRMYRSRTVYRKYARRMYSALITRSFGLRYDKTKIAHWSAPVRYTQLPTNPELTCFGLPGSNYATTHPGLLAITGISFACVRPERFGIYVRAGPMPLTFDYPGCIDVKSGAERVLFPRQHNVNEPMGRYLVQFNFNTMPIYNMRVLPVEFAIVRKRNYNINCEITNSFALSNANITHVFMSYIFMEGVQKISLVSYEFSLCAYYGQEIYYEQFIDEIPDGKRKFAEIVRRRPSIIKHILSGPIKRHLWQDQ